MRTALLRRRGVARATGVLAASAVASVGLVAFSTAATAEEPAPVTVEKIAPKAFQTQAQQLPQDLVQAIRRDLDLSPAEYLAHAAFAKKAAEAVDALKDSGVSINGAAVAGQELTIYIDAEVDLPLIDEIGATVEIGEPPADANDGEEPKFYLAADLTGGLGFFTPAPDNPTTGDRCSVGFNGTNAGGDPLFFTAGHCGANVPENTPVFHLDLDEPLFDETNVTLGDRIGGTGAMELGGGNDGGVVNVTQPGWTTPPQVAFWGGGTGAPDDGDAVNVYDSTDIIVGQPACKSGATSGWTCGQVTAAEDTYEVGADPDDPSSTVEITAFLFDACVLSGDSGGSIVSGNYALGVNSFSTEPRTDSCDGWDGEDVSGGFAVTSGTANAEALFGDDFNLKIHVGTPAVSAPADGDSVDQTPTFSGTVKAAAGATVTVAVEGGPTTEATVDGEGAWTASITEALEPGAYDYTVTASHTATGALGATTSEGATGTFEVVEQQVEDLVVTSPTNEQVTNDPRTPFAGTGQPGAEVSLTVGDDTLGTAEVADDGSWTIEPSKDLPVGVRFDATIAQTADGDVQDVTVIDLGVNAPSIKISGPEDGSTVAGNTMVTGTSFAGATVEVALTPAGDDDEPVEGDLMVEDDGSWTFTPAEALADGDYTVKAKASLEDGDPQLSGSGASVSFTVATESGDDDDNGGGDDDNGSLPDTGSSMSLWLVAVGVALLLAGGAAVAIRTRRNSGTA